MKSADLLITNAKILDNVEHESLISDAAVAIQDGKILQIGKTQHLTEQYSAERSWDAGNKLLLPGFINTHCHLFQVFMRGLGKDLPFLDWMNQSVRVYMPLLDEEAVYLAAMMGCLEAIRSGTTTLVDFMYANVKPGMAGAVLKAFDDCGIRGFLAYGITDVAYLPGSTVPASTYDTVGNRIAQLEQMKADYKSNPRIQFMFAPSVMWGMTRDGLAELAQYAKSQKVSVTMHLLETGDDDEYSLSNYGLRTLPLLEKVGILDTDFLAVHTIQLEVEDLELLKRYNSTVSHNPVANMILGNGVAPIPELYKAGIKIGMGTDGAASNDSQNMIEIMKSAALLQKVHHRDPTALTARQVFSMATSDGAAAIFMEDQIGSLEPGKQADILVIDLDHPNTTPCYDPISSLVYSGTERNIDSVFVEGQLIFEGGKFTSIDEADLINRTQEKAQSLYKIAFKE